MPRLTYAIVAVSMQGEIVYASPSIEGVLGYRPSELVGRPVTVIMPDRFHDSHRRGFINWRETGKRKINWDNLLVPGQHKSGDEVPLVVSLNESVIAHQRVLCASIRTVSVHGRDDAD